MHPLAQEFYSLFEGWHKNYGIYKLTGEVTSAGKSVGQAYSLAGDVTTALWHDHLTGIQGLGIIPITDQSKVKFAAIDVDKYDLDMKEVAKEIDKLKFPLVPCRTKSGGVHLYLFMNDWAPAKLVQQKMREMAAEMGFGNSEIFPKQTVILAKRGDIGQWINMPYFNADVTDRYAVDVLGRRLSAKDFLKYSFDRIVDPEELATRRVAPDVTDPLPDGPPCLNHLTRSGFPMGTRNNGLFNMGVYAQKVDPDNWVTLLADFNRKFMDPPLHDSEVMGVVKSLNKAKGYIYTCKQQPIVNHCNVNKCRACKYGIGVSGVGMPRYGTLSKIATTPPIWFVDVEGGGRVELQTEDLQYPKKYQTCCMEQLNVVPPAVKGEVWSEILSKLISDVNVVEVPQESTPQGLLWQFLEDFCTSRVQGRTMDELLLGKPWSDNKNVYFRMRDFMAFLERVRFRDFPMNKIAVYLREWGCEKEFLNLKGRGVNVYAIPIPKLRRQVEAFKVPDELKRGKEVM